MFHLLLVAATSGLKQLKINAHTPVEDDDKEQGKKLLSSLLRYFCALIQFSDEIDLCQVLFTAAKRQKMLEAIEREFEGKLTYTIIHIKKESLTFSMFKKF